MSYMEAPLRIFHIVSSLITSRGHLCPLLFVQRVLEDTLTEVNADGTYASLRDSVAKSKMRSEEKKAVTGRNQEGEKVSPN